MRFVLPFVLALAACTAEQPAVPDDEAQPVNAKYGVVNKVPAEFLGNWILAREKCEVDSEEVPSTDLPRVHMMLRDDRSYEMSIDGWVLSRGTFTATSSIDGNELQFDDTSFTFIPVDGTLENWSEGEAAFLCAKVFEREA